MNHLEFFVSSFKDNTAVFEMHFRNLGVEQASWKPAENKWSLLEVLCHLYDEEKEDFRYRLKDILEAVEQPLPPIDPQEWVTSRDYASKNLSDMLAKFLVERKQSQEWLLSLADANWENVYNHPKIGPMSAAFVLANWLAHDYLHFRQIARLKYEYLQHLGNPNLSYAGNL